jgi:Na+/H+ antiporter NhaA
MTGLSVLWIPILLSAVFAFVASFVLHMLIPWHKGDYRPVPNEDRAREAIRALAIPPGDYMMPCPSSREDMKSTAFAEKFKAGPVLSMTVMPAGQMSMGKNLAQWFVYCVVVSIFAAYITGRALPPGTVYLHVFRFAGATAFIGYSLALWQNSIWYRRAWTTTIKSTIDGLIYGLLTAGVFGWLWPR